MSTSPPMITSIGSSRTIPSSCQCTTDSIVVGSIANPCRSSRFRLPSTTGTSTIGLTGGWNSSLEQKASLIKLRAGPQSARIYTDIVWTDSITKNNLRQRTVGVLCRVYRFGSGTQIVDVCEYHRCIEFRHSRFTVFCSRASSDACARSTGQRYGYLSTKLFDGLQLRALVIPSFRASLL